MADWPALQNQIRIAVQPVQRIIEEITWENLTADETAARLRLADTMIHDWIEQIEAESRSVTGPGSPEPAANTDGERD